MDEMHDTALGLHNAGLISKRRMGEFDALRHLQVHEMQLEQTKRLSAFRGKLPADFRLSRDQANERD
ncbi:hypothetical protein CSC72_07855 [Pusillimonas noertemannii]|nr:hypothetical protein CSC72_07855 [Pusillimonas noertemannii]